MKYAAIDIITMLKRLIYFTIFFLISLVFLQGYISSKENTNSVDTVLMYVESELESAEFLRTEIEKISKVSKDFGIVLIPVSDFEKTLNRNLHKRFIITAFIDKGDVKKALDIFTSFGEEYAQHKDIMELGFRKRCYLAQNFNETPVDIFFLDISNIADFKSCLLKNFGIDY